MSQQPKAHEIEKINAVMEEVEASFNFIAVGLKKLSEQNSSVSNNHVPLQLFASGFERIVKILLLLKEKHLTGNYPEQHKSKEQFKNYNNGHGIEKMLDELIAYSKTVDLMRRIPMVREDMQFIENDKAFRQFLKIITEFSIQQRYYYIDAIVLQNSNQSYNPFIQFKRLMYLFTDGVDLSNLTYKQEEELMIHETIICIEKGVRAISRFFTHGLGNLGRQHYRDFSNFILLDDKDLGSLKYAEKKKLPSDLYKPINSRSFTFLLIALFAQSKTLYASNYSDWVFNVSSIRVYALKPHFYFSKIGNEIFALTGATSTRYKTPTYFASGHLKPKGVALYLLDEAQKLNNGRNKN